MSNPYHPTRHHGPEQAPAPTERACRLSLVHVVPTYIMSEYLVEGVNEGAQEDWRGQGKQGFLGK